MNQEVANDYGFLTDRGITLRATCIIDKNAIIRSIMINDMSVGRNIWEILHVVKTIHKFDNNPYDDF